MLLEPDSPVWYVAYGSNLLAARFGCYLAGGRPPGAGRTYGGSRDPRPPLGSVAVRLSGGLRFAGVSTVWTGGLAFYDPDGSGDLAARAYLVSFGQLTDVIAQESRQPVGTELVLGPTASPGRWPTASHVYDTLLHLGDLDDSPMLTITSLKHHPPTPPSEQYLRTILAGLLETFAWSDAERVDYLLKAPGVVPAWSNVDLAALCDPQPTTARKPGRRSSGRRGPSPVRCWGDQSGGDPMAGNFEVYQDQGGKFRWRLKAGNGEVVASGQSYPTLAAARQGTEAARRAADGAQVVEVGD